MREFESWYQENVPLGANNEMNEEEKEIVKQIDVIQTRLDR